MAEEEKSKLGSEHLLGVLVKSVERQRVTNKDAPLELAIIGVGLAICMSLEDIARQLMPKGTKGAKGRLRYL